MQQEINFTEKIAICYTTCGPTYRNTAIEKLKNLHFDHPNLYYFVITEDKSYFDDIQRENLIVRELKEFYQEYPEVEEHEKFLDSTDDVAAYGKQVQQTGWRFPFSVARFHLKIAEEFNITNLALLCTDTDLRLDLIDDTFLERKDTVYNAVSWWDTDSEKELYAKVISDTLYDLHKIRPSTIYRVLDGAARMFILSDMDMVKKLFHVWNTTNIQLYKQGDMFKYFAGSIAMNDEWLISGVYNAIGIKIPHEHNLPQLFTVLHNSLKERPWAVYG